MRARPACIESIELRKNNEIIEERSCSPLMPALLFYVLSDGLLGPVLLAHIKL